MQQSVHINTVADIICLHLFNKNISDSIYQKIA